MTDTLPADNKPSLSWKSLALLSVAALGVVYGDIGTSPLYAINEMFFGHNKHAFTPLYVEGAISLVIWTLTILISIKYITFVLRADNDGEGGVFALYSLLNVIKSKSKLFIMPLLVVAAGLLFGEGIITPAISVISAVEGLKVATSVFNPFIIPLTIGILTGLFMIQKNGTAKVGRIFGPVIIVWFICIALMGFFHILDTPQIIQSFNPLLAIQFLFMNDLYSTLLILGSAMLVVTGGEAMYADMSHFGSLPIRISWFYLVYPALILNYLGQGAYLLSGRAVVNDNIFYSMVPGWGLYPMVALATAASLIASQALISGAFSLAQQAVSLGLFPFLKIIHTHHEHEGQIYVPFINWALFIGSVLLVLYFQSSAHLAAAYGLSVSGVMLVNSFAMMQIARHYWKWSTSLAVLLFGAFAAIDGTFFIANTLKFFHGGFIPLTIGIIILFIIKTWEWGRGSVRKKYAEYPRMTIKEFIRLKEKAKFEILRPIVIMTPQIITSVDDPIPLLGQIRWDRYGTISKHIIFLTVDIHKVPYLHKDRYDILRLFEDKKKGSIIYVKVNFGFMQQPDVESALADLAKNHLIHIDEHHRDWLIRIVQERTNLNGQASAFDKMRFFLFKFLQNNTSTADQYFGLGYKQHLSTEILPVKLS